jgi:hypothetical protein
MYPHKIDTSPSPPSRKTASKEKKSRLPTGAVLNLQSRLLPSLPSFPPPSFFLRKRRDFGKKEKKVRSNGNASRYGK